MNRYRIKKNTLNDGEINYFIEVRYLWFFWSHTTNEGHIQSNDLIDPYLYYSVETAKEKIDEFILRDNKNKEEEKQRKIKKIEIIKYP